MSDLTYNWKRYWYPRGQQVTVLPNGFLQLPQTGEFAFFKTNTVLVGFEEIANVPCLILLGEPGIGKSQAMQDAYNVIDVGASNYDNNSHFINLKEYSEIELSQELDEVLDEWSLELYHLHLFLDSLDEARLRISTTTHILRRKLQKHSGHLNRLHLRIACRIADWPVDFEEQLNKLWSSEGAVQAYILAPLRQQDVEEAAKANALDPKALVQEILQKEVGPLAANPITLNFLIRSYRENKQLSKNRYDLYLQGCETLCREEEETHKGRDRLSTKQRFMTAARIGACTIFTNRYGVDMKAVWEEDIESGCIAIPQLSGGEERVNKDLFPVGEEAIRETLDTALFHGSSYRVWAHKTYAEFLAAWYIQYMTSAQIRTLIFHPDGKLVPQLHQTAAWLATMKSEIFGDILNTEPQVLLRSDIMTTDSKAKADLTEALLKLYESEPLRDYSLFAWHSKLLHPNLAEQIKPYIEDMDKSIPARIVAIDIAEACKLQILQDSLAEAALDLKNPIEIRADAARVVAKIGDAKTKAKLKPLALIPVADIKDRQMDNLKMYGLEATWPDHITAEELFASLVTPQKGDFIFLGNYLPDLVSSRLKSADLPVALAWFQRQSRRHDLYYSFNELMNSIMLRAWECLEMEGIADAFARAAVSRFLKYDQIVDDEPVLQRRTSSLFNQKLRNDDMKRRLFLRHILPFLAKFERTPYGIHNTPLIASDDIPWLAQQFAITDSEAQKAVLAELMTVVLWRNTDKFEAVYYACKNDPTLEKALGFPFDPISLDSPLAQQRKKEEAERKKWEQEAEERQNSLPLTPSPKERAISLLEACESGKPEDWWRITYWMMFKTDGTSDLRESETDMEVYPVWTEIDNALRARLVKTAKDYIRVYDPNTHDWLESNTLYRPVIAGYKALRLLTKYAIDFLAILPVDIWQRWALVLLFYAPESKSPQSENGETESLDQTLIRMAYRQAPDVIIEAFTRLIDLENKRGLFLITPWAKVFWDEHLAQVLIEKVKDKNLKPSCLELLLGLLLTHDETVQQAQEFAKSLILQPISEDGQRKERAIASARALAINTVDACWSFIWPIIQRDSEFGKELVKSLVSPRPYNREVIEPKLNETQLADFYIWLVRQFPPDRDPKWEGFYSPTVEHDIASFRDSMLGYLREKGTSVACLQLQRIANEFPQLNLKWHLLQAQDLFRRKTWIWPQPQHILELARDREKGLVESGEQLLNTIVESLNRLQAKLHNDKFPAVFDLWNDVNWSRVRGFTQSLSDVSEVEFSGSKDDIVSFWKHSVNWKKIERTKLYTPKDEEHLSDYVARHLVELKTRGIIVNREVDIRHGRGRTDIYVEAFKKNTDGMTYDPITVVIEVKGCWNPQLLQAMATQLANYSSYGIYLVGLFNCGLWHPSDYRSESCQKYTLEKLQKQLALQALKLSENGLRVKVFALDAGLP